MRRLSSSSTTTGRTMSWKSTQTEDIHTLDQQLQRTPDGGNYSDVKENTLDASIKIRTNTLWFKELLIPKEDTFNKQPRMERSINNGTLSTLTNGRESQPRVNLTKNMDSTSREISMSSLPLTQEDISKSSTTETWLSRQETLKEDRFGTSIKDL